MKLNYLNTLLFLGLFGSFLSCSSDEPSSGAKEGSVTAMINTSKFEADTAGANISNGKISFFAQSKDLTSITFLLQDTEKGEYSIEYGSAGNIATLSPANQGNSNPLFSNVYPGEFEDAVGGKFTITELNTTDKTMSGTFEVNVTRVIPEDSMVKITKGSFNKIKYSEGSAQNTTSTLAAKIDGQTFTPELAAGVVSNQKIVINGTIGGDESIAITVPSTIVAGTYNLGDMTSTYSGTYLNGSQYYVASSGKLVISKHDKTAKVIVGTFNFNASDMMGGSSSVTITEGSFSIKYQ